MCAGRTLIIPLAILTYGLNEAIVFAQQAAALGTPNGLVLYQVDASAISKFESATQAALAVLQAKTDAETKDFVSKFDFYRVATETGASALFVQKIRGGIPTQSYAIQQLLWLAYGKEAGEKTFRSLLPSITNIQAWPLVEPGSASRSAPSLSIDSGGSPSDLTASYTTRSGTVALNATSRVTERNDVWWRYSFRVVIANKSTTPFEGRMTIEFQDADGFPIDDTLTDQVTVHPGTSETVTGFALIKVPGATRVRQIRVK